MTLGKRIVIVGVSASGKSTFARKFSERTGIPLTLMDAIMWKPNWQYIGDEATAEKLLEISEGDLWIIEGYITKGAREVLFERADTIIYLDYSPLLSSARYIQRWFMHRNNPRPELPGSPEKFSWKFLKLIWTKGEAISLEKFLNSIQNQQKIMRLKTPRMAKQVLMSLEDKVTAVS